VVKRSSWREGQENIAFEEICYSAQRLPSKGPAENQLPSNNFTTFRKRTLRPANLSVKPKYLMLTI
jgi:hypothetical protein